MKNIYKVEWTTFALGELQETINYLEENFTEKELKTLAKEIEKILSLIAQNPLLFPYSDRKKIRAAVVAKYNTLYYRIVNERIEVLSFFSNRQNPEKRRI